MAKLSKNTQTVLAIGGVILVLGILARKSIAAGVDAVANVNQGTPFEGAGIIGTLGNVADTASGGVLADTGSAIGLFFSNYFDRRTLDELTGTG